jgi:hypothetical protein
MVSLTYLVTLFATLSRVDSKARCRDTLSLSTELKGHQIS